MRWLLLISMITLSSCTTFINILNKKKDPLLKKSTSTPISHDIWDGILHDHVKNTGRVDYKGIIQDREKFDEYITLLETNHPNQKWNRDEQVAYWINAYNAFTVKLIIDNYPVNSIKDVKSGGSLIKSVWNLKFITIEGQEYDLSDIEHGILRKSYDEPRIHFAVNCASISCPPIRAEAYLAETLDEQLEKATKEFINDEKYNKVTAQNAEISKIFKWYKGDFEKNGQNLKSYIAKYVSKDLSKDFSVSYTNYNWGLNDI